MARLLNQVRDATRRLHYSIRTEDAYAAWIKRFIVFHGKRHPLEIGEPEVVAFLTQLVVQRDVAASTQNQALSALRFLYKVVPGWPPAPRSPTGESARSRARGWRLSTGGSRAA